MDFIENLILFPEFRKSFKVWRRLFKIPLLVW